MATDFTYNDKTINISGPAKPSGKNQPLDPRTEVKLYADIESIPSPYVGMIITVLEDETNSNKMTDYKVLSLKANASGIANSVVDQVQRYVDYLGAGSVSQEDINTAVNNYLTEHPVASGATAEQAAQITKNKDSISDIINNKLDGHSFKFLTQAEYDNLSEEEKNNSEIEYHITDAIDDLSLYQLKRDDALTTTDKTIVGAINEIKTIVLENTGGTSDIPEYSASDANKILSVNSDGTALGWVSTSIGGSLVTRDIEDGEILTVSNEVIPVIAYGNIVTSVSTISINEGEEYEFTVRLSPAPTVDQQVTISVNNDNCTVDRSSLTFTPNNYNVTQTVKVTGTHNSTDYTNLTSVISLASTKVETKKINVTIVNIDDSNPLNSISAVYNQGDTKVYTTNSLDSLKSNLVVTAKYSDNSTQTVTDYSLSGTLTEGTSTITVTYQGKTTTFNVTVTASETPVLTSISAVYNQGYTKVYTISSVNSLKNNLVVTAHYNDNSTQTVTDYSLSGTLTEGTSTITVTYEDKTTTFDVNVEVLEINENSNAYIKDGYLYLNTKSINRAGGVYLRNNKTTPDPDHQYFDFKAYTACGYSGSEITYENTEKRHNNVIEFAGDARIDDFNAGNIECADFAYIKSNTSLYYRIPTSAYEAAGNDIINGLASEIPMLPTLINPNKTLTIYTITDEIIDTITTGHITNTATTEGERHTGFLSLDPNISGIKENLKCETSLGGVCGSINTVVPTDYWDISVGGGRLNYSISYGKIPGNTVDDIKAYLKANRLIFYKFN